MASSLESHKLLFYEAQRRLFMDENTNFASPQVILLEAVAKVLTSRTLYF